MKTNSSCYNFQTETLVMLTSAKNTGYNEVLMFILELLLQVKSDCHEILSGALVYGDLQHDQRILYEVDWKLSKYKQRNQFLKLEYEFWKKL